MDEKLKLPEPLLSLVGGIERSALTNFYGPPGVGKTNICLIACLECIKNGGTVTYVDTEGGFSVERLKQIVGEENFDKTLKKIIIVQPKNFKDQGKAIKSLEKADTDMIIVDSVVSLYRLECADENREILEANKELSVQLSILSNISREKNIPVIITTHTFKKWDTGENEIIGGFTVKYWSKAIIFIEHTGKMSERKATVIKHRSVPEGKTVKFFIVEDGIKPSGFKIF